MRPYILAETNWEAVQNTDFSVAVLPWGATEAHNYHLPYATDNYQNEWLVAESAKRAWERDAKVVVLPNMPFGINTGQLDISLCMNLNPSTQYAILKDLVDVVQRAGIRKFIIFNGHGGNNFKTMIRELAIDFPDMFVCAVNWFMAGGDWADYFDHLGDHAGELETSVMMHIHPELCRPLNAAGDGAARQWKIKGLREGWVTSQRQWTKVTADTGVGDPSASTADKGARFLESCAANIADFFVELAESDHLDLYE
ncbi:MAG: creatininase family protein [Bacteroidota bacterium]